MNNGFPDTLYASDRESAKGHADYPLTLEYIERLERIAKAAHEVWKNTPHANTPSALTVSCLEDLCDSLDSVNFLDETL